MRRLLLRSVESRSPAAWSAFRVRAHGPVAVQCWRRHTASKYRKNVDGVGGTFGIYAGYRFDLCDHLAVSFLANPQFTFMPTEEGCCRGKNDHETGTTFSITSGPSLSFLAGLAETYVGAGRLLPRHERPDERRRPRVQCRRRDRFRARQRRESRTLRPLRLRQHGRAPGHRRRSPVGARRRAVLIRVRRRRARGSRRGTASASAPAASTAAGAPPHRAPRRQLRLRQVQHSVRCAADPR